MYRSIPAFLALALIPGCGTLCGLLGLPDDCLFGPSETGSAELKAFQSEEELSKYLTDQIEARNADFSTRQFGGALEDGDTASVSDQATGGDAAAPTSGEAGDGGQSDFSQTTIQEQGVDESDVVKTDGTHLYVISGSAGGSVLRIIDVSVPAQMVVLDEVNLDGHGREIYLHDDKIVAITQTFGGFVFLGGPTILLDPLPAQDVSIAPEPVDAVDSEEPGVIEPDPIDDVHFDRPETIVTIVDVSVKTAMTVESKTRFDGSPSSNRMIDGVLHLVISNFQNYYFDVLPRLGSPELDVSAVTPDELLPGYVRTAGDGSIDEDLVVTWRELYRPTDADGFGVVTVVSLDVDNDAAFTAVGVVAEPGLIYSSLNALYLTDTDYDFLENSRETTDIYKLTYRDRGAEPVATGTVPGRILNQYSMGEHNGYLRVATTIGSTFSALGERSGPTNGVYILNQPAGTLDVVASLDNIEPGETIRSARFLGDRGYLVTFREIDPLLTMDLSDPFRPQIMGKLEIPGFSTFLVPVDDDHLLAVGQYIPSDGFFFSWGVQLSIFDVSDFSNPQRTHNVVLGETSGASSEALYNPKAFTYFAERGLVALPLSIYEDIVFFDPVIGVTDGDTTVVSVDTDGSETGSGDAGVSLDEFDAFVPGGFEGLVVFSVSAQDGFNELGRISTRFEDAGIYWSEFTRGVFIGDDVLAVTNNGVRGAPVSDIAGVPFELLTP